MAPIATVAAAAPSLACVSESNATLLIKNIGAIKKIRTNTIATTIRIERGDFCSLDWTAVDCSIVFFALIYRSTIRIVKQTNSRLLS